MSSAQTVWELSRAALADKDGWVAVFKTYIDESGIHDGSPVLTVGAYLARPKIWRDWTKKWNTAKKPIKVYHAADAANLEGEFEDWPKEKMNALAAKLLPLIGNAELSGALIGIHMGEFNIAMEGRQELRELLGNPYGACFNWLVGTVLRIANHHDNKERIAFFHEVNDYREEARQSFAWIEKNINQQGRIISLTFGSKADYTPLQAADILAYEGNKRLRNWEKTPRRAWTALNPKEKIIVGHFGKHNMQRLIDDLSAMRRELDAVGWDGKGDPYWAARAYEERLQTLARSRQRR